MTEKPRLLVDIVADPVCPWCYVGLRGFLAAKESLSTTFDILPRFRAYQLNPNTPKDGTDRLKYYEKKFPDTDKRATLIRTLVTAAKESGFEFDPMLPKRLPNTLSAQQVMRWSHHEGLQEPFAIALYQSFWDGGADIGDANVLVEIAASVGMDAAVIRHDIENAVDRDAVAAEASAFSRAGVSGVPTFIVNEQTGFSGAMPPTRLAAALVQAVKQCS